MTRRELLGCLSLLGYSNRPDPQQEPAHSTRLIDAFNAAIPLTSTHVGRFYVRFTGLKSVPASDMWVGQWTAWPSPRLRPDGGPYFVSVVPAVEGWTCQPYEPGFVFPCAPGIHTARLLDPREARRVQDEILQARDHLLLGLSHVR